MGTMHTVGQSEAMIVSDDCCASADRSITLGGTKWVWWYGPKIQWLSMEVISMKLVCEAVTTAQGAKLTITGVVKCKVMVEPELIAAACELFLGRDVAYIKGRILPPFEHHLKAVLGTLTAEEVIKDRDKFAWYIQEAAALEVGCMGFEIVNITIKDILDEQEYLSSTGKARIAAFKRNANNEEEESSMDDVDASHVIPRYSPN